MKQYFLFALLSLSVIGCRTVHSQTAQQNDVAIAFPGAEGFGKYTTGGRGGKVFIVSNLHDKGPGSFRQAAEAKEKRIIITHGTDTMAETARLLAKKIKDKTIVLTGAMIPYKFGSSDGLFNLGSALAFVQTLSKGVYVVMNGRYFDANNVRKNKETGLFEELEND